MAKKLAAAGFLLILLGWAGTAGAVKARAMEVSLGFFYNELAPYGEWVTVDPFGWVWCPYDVAPDWRPYTDGDWLYSDYGWTFDSPVEWGWACYHYGRWGFNDQYGWFWVPGTVWGPAWVAWRFGGGVIGWAPLPPEVGWSFGMGLEWGGLDLDYGIGWPWWSFCQVSRFGERHLDRDILGPGRNQVLFRTTRNVTNYRIQGGRIVDENIGLAEIEQEAGRKIVRYSLAETPSGEGRRTPLIRGQVLQVFKPVVLADRTAEAPRNILPPRRASISAQKMEKRQRQEVSLLNQRHQAEQQDLSSMHRQETPPQGGAREELDQRHQTEMKALEEQHRKEAQALENKHKREQEQRQAAESQRRQSAGSEQRPRRKSP